jgi:hypothetical protein
MPAKKKAASKKKPAGSKTRRRRGVTVKPVTLAAAEVGIDRLEGDLQGRPDGGAALGAHREPPGGHALLLVSPPRGRMTRRARRIDVDRTRPEELARSDGSAGQQAGEGES